MHTCYCADQFYNSEITTKQTACIDKQHASEQAVRESTSGTYPP